MKAISLQQPWASMVCAGIKDVENRSWAANELPQRILIHASKEGQPIKEEDIPFAWRLFIENALDMGVMTSLDELPSDAIIGVVTLCQCVTESESRWAHPDYKYKWLLKDPQFFKEPITDVKGEEGLFDVPGIDTDNLPERYEAPNFKREGDHLTIPLADYIFDQLANDEADALELNLLEENLWAFTDVETLEELPTKTVTFVSGDKRLDADIVEYYVYNIEDKEQEDGIFIYHDPQGEELMWMKVYIRVKKH